MSELDYPIYENTDEISGRQVLAILRRRRWTLLVSLTLAAALGLYLTSQMTPVYQAQATMLVEQSPMRIMHTEDLGVLSGPMQPTQPHSLETQVEMLKSAPLQSSVMQRISPIPPGAGPSLSVAQVRETDFIQVVAESTVPRVARDAANALVQEFIVQNESNNLSTVRKTRQYAEHRLAEAQTQLAGAEGRLRSFKERYHLPDLLKNRENAIAQANSIQEELRLNENQLTSLASQIGQVQTQIAREPQQVSGSRTISANPRADIIRSEISRLEQSRISLLRTYLSSEPEVRAVDEQIAQFRRELKRLPATIQNGTTYLPNPELATLQGQLKALKIQRGGLASQVALLRRQHQDATNRLVSFPSWEADLSRLQGERDDNQSEVRSLSDQLRQLRLREEAQAITARPMNVAQLPGSPVRPRLVMNMMAALVLGLMFGVGAACLREMTDDRVYTADEAERLTGLPVLGRVPNMPTRDPVLISAEREAPLKDAYRRLRAAIQFAANTTPIRSLMITSATEGEGKSTTAANLAVATALQGRRVILVDADLRGSSLAALFGVQAEPGLTDLLSGQEPVHRVLHPTGIKDLLLVPAGSPAAHSSELLAGPRMRELVDELTGLADLVIVDTPPCLPVADAEVLGSQMDAAALVIGLGHTDKEAVRMARDLLEQAHVRVLGAVLNRMKAGDHRYYYRYRTPASVAAGPQTRRALPPQPSAAPAPDRLRQENEG